MNVLRDILGWGHDVNRNAITLRNSTERSVNVFVEENQLVLEVQKERNSNDFEYIKVPVEMVLNMLEAEGLLNENEES